MDEAQLEALLSDPDFLALLGGLDEQQAEVMRQQGQSERMRQYVPQASDYRTPIGSALGGIGQVLGSYGLGQQDDALRQEMAKLLRTRSQGRQTYGQQLVRGEMGLGGGAAIPWRP